MPQVAPPRIRKTQIRRVPDSSSAVPTPAGGNGAPDAAPPQFIARGPLRSTDDPSAVNDARFRAPDRAVDLAPVAPVSGYDNPPGGSPSGDAGDAPPAAAPGMSVPGKYVVQPNDNYWTICEKVYGAGAFFKALQQYNGGLGPSAARLQVGEVVEVPPTTVLRQKFGELCPKPRREQAASRMQPVSAGPRQCAGATIYTVEQGDTLFDIARHQLGKASRWIEIYDMNREALGDDFHYLRPGTELVIPNAAAQSAESLTRQPGGAMQR